MSRSIGRRIVTAASHPFAGKRAGLAILSMALAWTVFRSAGVHPEDWNATVLMLALLSFPVLSSAGAPKLDRWMSWPCALLCVWVLLQSVPLPLSIVRWVSPARAELASALPVAQWATISVCPPASLAGWLRLSACMLVFLIVRELAWQFSEKGTPWIIILPVVIVASAEAALSLLQFRDGHDRSVFGTFQSRDHFAGLLEMALPFPVMYGCTVWRRGQTRLDSPLRPALLACCAFGIAALLLMGVVQSLSRMGLIASLCGLAVFSFAALPHKIVWFAAPVAAVLCFVAFSPGAVISRFADVSTIHGLASQDRVQVWRETMPLIRSYLFTGCGINAFEFTFPRYKQHAPAVVDNYAHNDYLQYLAELGVAGFAIGLMLVAGIVFLTVRGASRHPSPSGRALALAALGSISALLLHSTVDFNTYIPANAFALSWICGLAASVMFSSRPGTRARNSIVETGSRRFARTLTCKVQETICP